MRNKISGGYYGHTREDILNLIPDGSNRILEVGCAKGYTLKRLKEFGKANETVGIEINQVAAMHAQNHLDHVIEGNIDKMDSLPFDKKYFDYIIFNDVLEHLISPWKVLKMVREYLNDSGSIIATIPNLRHKSIILPLILHGEFQYNPEGGGLDISHMRFFTRKSVELLFKSTGYSKIHFADYPLSFRAKILTFMSCTYLKDFFVYKFRIIAEK